MNSIGIKAALILFMSIVVSAPVSRAQAARNMAGDEVSGVWHASRLMGAEVRDDQGQKLGKVNDLVLDTRSGEIAFAIISYGGFAGLGKSEVAVPLPAFRVDLSGRTLFLDVSRQALQNAPVYQPRPQRLTDARWRDNLHDYYVRESSEYKRWSEMNASRARREMAEASAEGARPGNLIQASKLIGLSVQNPQSESIGRVQDLILDAGQGKALYALIEIDNIRNADGKLASTPWGAMEVQPESRAAIVKADNEMLASIAYSPAEMPNLASRTFAERIYRQFNEQPYWTTYGYMGEEEGTKTRAERMKESPFRQNDEGEYPTGQESNPW
jgi:sporulation protein YlmC with PRC-barrel domain